MVTLGGFIEFEHAESKMTPASPYALALVAGDALVGARIAEDTAHKVAGTSPPVADIARAVAEQYEATAARLAGAGYERYEVSNWARPGWACRHNLTYWRDEPFIGVGAGAAGWLDGVRTKNTPSPRRYMASIAARAVERVEAERPTRLTQAEDFLALGLRLREGIEPRQFEARFGMSLSEALGDVTEQLVQAGCLEWVADRLRIAEGSVLVTNELLLRLHEALAQRFPRFAAGDEPTRSGDASLQPSAEQQQVALPI